MLEELNQNLKGFQFKLYRLPIDPQFEARFIKFPPGKTPQASGTL